MNDLEQRIRAAFAPYRASVTLEEVRGSALGERPRRDRRPRSWSRRISWAAAAAALAVGVAIIPSLLSSDPLHGALAIEQHGDMLHVEVEDALADSEAMTNDLRAAGLDATVSTVPVSPSLVGGWVNVMNLAGADQDPRIVDLIDQTQSHVDTLRIPSDFSSAVGLFVGRPARPGERWEIASEMDSPDLLGSGGELACLGFADLTPIEVDRRLVSMGYQVIWSVVDAELPSSEVVPSAPATGIVFEARLVGPDLLDVRVAVPGSDLARQAVSRSEGATC